jgi:glycosyltransferase involved in cell wall biosynthesis
MSETDRQVLLAANPRLRVEVAPNGVDTHAFRPLPAPEGPPALVFVGNMSYPPCVDAMVWFCSEILPLIRAQRPGVEMWIVGINPAPEVRRLEGDGVHVTGRVPDVTPYYERSGVSVVPIRAGGGTRLKILEAMALGRPVVSTTIGAEGLDIMDGNHVLLADDPRQFAEKTLQLLSDAELYRRLAADGRALAVNRYDWDVIARDLLRVFSDVAAISQPASPSPVDGDIQTALSTEAAGSRTPEVTR